MRLLPPLRSRGAGGDRAGAGAGASVEQGATVFGLPLANAHSPEWAAWANGVAVRELDFHDTYLAADYSHPGDNIPPILAVAQHCGLDGAALAARPRDRL